jgi:hypothetical protein
MSPQERALAETEAEIARRSARRIDRYLSRPDLGPVLREVARAQRDEYLQEAQMIEASLWMHDLAPRRSDGCECGEWGGSPKTCPLHGYVDRGTL